MSNNYAGIDSDSDKATDFDRFIKDNWPDGLESDCTKLGKNDSDCIQRDEDKPCPSCEKFIQLSNEFEELHRATKEAERAQATSVCDAAIALIVAESLLMEAPIRKEEIETRDIGDVLDAAHEFVHWFHNKKGKAE